MRRYRLGVKHTRGTRRRRACLTPDDMEVLRRRRRVRDAHVVLGAEGEEPLDARTRVLGALALEPVGQQQRKRWSR